MPARLTSILSTVTVAITLGLVAPAVANDFGPGYKTCGSFKSSYTIRVGAKGMSCKRAVAIQKEYWNGPDSRKVIHNGGAGASGWIKLKRFPGYTCYSGAGAGSCRNKKGTKVAAYINR